MGQMIQPTVPKHLRKYGPKDNALIPTGPPYHVTKLHMHAI